MNSRTEQVALLIGAVVGMVMAAAGWVAYYLSGAEVLLLDGNFSFIGVLATLLAVFISLIKTRTSRTYPFGQFVFEPSYSLFIGLLTVGVIVVAVATNATKVVDYLQGERFPAIDTSVILVYTLVMTVLCFGLAGLFRYSNHRLRGSSTILGAYTVQATIDGILSAVGGGALLGFGFVPAVGAFAFLNQIGDSIIVVVLCVLVLYQPIKLVRDSFVEVSGGALNDRAVANEIRSIVSAHIDEEEISDLFISKTGSAYLVAAFMRPGFFVASSARELVRLKRDVKEELEARLGYVAFELALSQDAEPTDGCDSVGKESAGIRG